MKALCENTTLIKHILKNSVLDKEDINKFNALIEKDALCKERSIHTVFDLTEDEETHEWAENFIVDNFKKLNESHKELCETPFFALHICKALNVQNKEFKLKLINLTKNSEVARNKLKEIVENHLESNFDFDSLMQYLSKKEKRNLFSI